MVIGLLAITAIPTTIGVGQAISAQKREQANQTKDQEKFFLMAQVCQDGSGNFQDACFCMLKDGKLWLDLPDFPVPSHRFCGWYFKYPSEAGHMGLVSMISDDPPMLNWIYVDKDTGIVSHGGRKDTTDHVIGPWGWSLDEKLLVLEGGGDKFIAVKERQVPKPAPPPPAPAPAEGQEQAQQAPAVQPEPEPERPVTDYPLKWAVCWDPDGRKRRRLGRGNFIELRLRRQLQMGINSQWVKGSGKK